MKTVITRGPVICFATMLSVLFSLSASAVNVTFDGELQDRPCQIAPESLNKEVIFLERPVTDFQFGAGRGPAEKFSIRLMDCDTTSVWKTVKLKFSGDREPNMTEQSDYFIRVAGINQGKLAVGLLDTDGVTPLKLGEMHNHGQGTPINDNMLSLDFQAFVQATPEALEKKSVQPGNYSATANFELFYE